MDRCRCEEYDAAVKNIKFYTVGTIRPDILENYDRSQYTTRWVKMGITNMDRKFKRPKVWKNLSPNELPGANLTPESRKIEQMWCSYMTPRKEEIADD